MISPSTCKLRTYIISNTTPRSPHKKGITSRTYNIIKKANNEMEKVAIEACRLGGSPPPLYNNRPEGTRNPTALEKEKKKNSFSFFLPPSPAPSSHPRLRTDGVCSPLVPPNTGQFPPSSLHCHNSAQKHFGFSFAAAVPLVPKERVLSPSLSRVQSRGALQPNPGCCCRRRRWKEEKKRRISRRSVAKESGRATLKRNFTKTEKPKRLS